MIWFPIRLQDQKTDEEFPSGPAILLSKIYRGSGANIPCTPRVVARFENE
jgi:hypothetical protein